MKPENILYVSRAADAEVKLTDFGLAMLDDGASTTRRDDNLVGTPGWVGMGGWVRSVLLVIICLLNVGCL